MRRERWLIARIDTIRAYFSLLKQMCPRSFRKIKSLLKGDKFLVSAGVLAGGTVVSQVLALAALPVLTRLYSPSDFSQLAAFASCLAIIGAIACLRFEIAIPIPADEQVGAALLTLSLASATLVAAIVAILIGFIPIEAFPHAIQFALNEYAWLLPLGVWMQGAYSAMQYWSTRRKCFGDVARTRATQTLAGLLVQIVGGATGVGLVGLLAGQVINCGSGALSLGRKAIKTGLDIRNIGDLLLLRRTVSEYRRFPLLSTIEASISSIGLHFPIIIIAALGSAEEAGYFLLASRIAATPLSLLGAAASQVYLSFAGESYRQGDLSAITGGVVSRLSKIGAGPLIFIGIVSPSVIPAVLGEQWARTGLLVSLMTPWLVLQLLASPISMVMHITNKVSQLTLLTAAGAILKIGATLAPSFCSFLNPALALIAASAIYYAISLCVFTKASGMAYRALFKTILGSSLYWSPWIAIGLVVTSIPLS